MAEKRAEPETKPSKDAAAAEAAEAVASQAAADVEAADAVPGVEELMPGLADAVAEEDAGQAEMRIAELEGELATVKDRLLRALAEAENVRRRAERDRKDAETYGGTRLARDLLAVHDNMARAMSAADDSLRTDHAAFIEGMELTQRELLNAFGKHKIAPLTPELGEKFDPNRHQAMFEAPVPGATPGTVIEVMQAGFVIADRLLRPALVGVAKAAPGAPEPSEDTAVDTEEGAEEKAEGSAG
ncbi:MAG: nucleotide exchange factor GrpE [Pseudomonadota bacterium]